MRQFHIRSGVGGHIQKALSLGHRFARVDARCSGENAAQMPELMLRDRG
jgi:hypothetical protein